MLSISRTIFVAFICLPTLAMAQLNAFSPGDPIRSSEMNDNFEYLEDQIKGLEAQVESLSQGAGFLTSCSRSDLAGDWVGGTADAELGFASYFLIVDSSGSISGSLLVETGSEYSISGSIDIRSSCTLSALTLNSSAGVDVFGRGYGALSRDGSTLLVTVEDSRGLFGILHAVKVP